MGDNPWAGRTVLLTDDEPSAVEFIRNWFHGQGARVLEATDAARSIELLHTEKPELVWLDIYLSAGAENLARRLRRMYQEHWGGLLVLDEMARLRDPPELIVATGSVSNIVAVRRAAQMDFELLSKPLSYPEALATLKKVGEGLACQREPGTEAISR